MGEAGTLRGAKQLAMQRLELKVTQRFFEHP